MTQSNHITVHEIVTTHLDKREKNLTLTEQCNLLGIGRTSMYYQPRLTTALQIDLMNRIDKIHTDFPYYGSRKIAKTLTQETGIQIGRKRIRTLMEEMGIEAIYPKPNVSYNNKPHNTFPYLLKGVAIVRPNQVWSSDITYVKMRSGFLYLVVFMDWYSRYILSWQLSDSLKSDFCIEAAHNALTLHVPDIVNFDQGVQFTDQGMIQIWEYYKTQISMDHKGRCFDNIFTERFWRSFKYEEVYLKDYTSFADAKTSIGSYIERYNTLRIHQALDYKTPVSIYFS